MGTERDTVLMPRFRSLRRTRRLQRMREHLQEDECPAVVEQQR
jgi:hypothetical protein